MSDRRRRFTFELEVGPESPAVTFGSVRLPHRDRHSLMMTDHQARHLIAQLDVQSAYIEEADDE